MLACFKLKSRLSLGRPIILNQNGVALYVANQISGPPLCLVLTVNPPLWFDLLSEHREVVIGQHSSIQGVHSLPRVCRSMRSLPMVLH